MTVGANQVTLPYLPSQIARGVVFPSPAQRKLFLVHMVEVHLAGVRRPIRAVCAGAVRGPFDKPAAQRDWVTRAPLPASAAFRVPVTECAPADNAPPTAVASAQPHGCRPTWAGMVSPSNYHEMSIPVADFVLQGTHGILVPLVIGVFQLDAPPDDPWTIRLKSSANVSTNESAKSGLKPFRFFISDFGSTWILPVDVKE